jgi:DNA-binding NarL/FixJ family response regulator
MRRYDNTNLKRELLEGDELTAREIEVLRLAAEGKTAKQIGEQIHLAEETVKGHRKYAMYKLGAHNVTHAVVTAIKRGII